MSFNIVIPARFDSSRLPGKVLADIAGKPMVQWVYEQALKSGADQVIIATDNTEVKAAVESFGAPCCMTDSAHPTGTDRIAETARQLNWLDEKIVVNVQADVPLIKPELIRLVAEQLAGDSSCRTATLAIPIHDKAELLNPNVVKVVLNHCQQAMYFSRAPIPWDRQSMNNATNANSAQPLALHHIGLYAYRVAMLANYHRLTPTALEVSEGLEQLRLLFHGEKITVALAEHYSHVGVDTESDLVKIKRCFMKNGKE